MQRNEDLTVFRVVSRPSDLLTRTIHDAAAGRNPTTMNPPKNLEHGETSLPNRPLPCSSSLFAILTRPG